MSYATVDSYPQLEEEISGKSVKQEEIITSPNETFADRNEESDENMSVNPATEHTTGTLKHQQSRVLKTCFICNREFTRGTNLRRHLAIIHRLNPLSLLASSEHNDCFNEDSGTSFLSNVNEKLVSKSDSDLLNEQNKDKLNNLSHTKREFTQPCTSDFDALPSMALYEETQQNNSPCLTEQNHPDDSDKNVSTIDNAATGNNSKQLKLKLPKPIKMCPYCGKTFTRNTNLRRHLENDVCRGGLITWETKAYSNQFLSMSQKMDEDPQSKVLDTYLVTSPLASSNSTEIEDDESKMISMSRHSRREPESHIVPGDFTHQLSTQNSTTHGLWTVSDSMCSTTDMVDCNTYPSPLNEDIHTVIPSDSADNEAFGNDNDYDKKPIIYRTFPPSSTTGSLSQHSSPHEINDTDIKPASTNSQSWYFSSITNHRAQQEDNMAEENFMSSTEEEELTIPVVLPSDYVPPDGEDNEFVSNQFTNGNNNELTSDGVENLSMEDVAAFQQIAGDNQPTGWKLLSCNICRKQYSDVQILLKHLMIHRNSEKEIYNNAAQRKEMVTKSVGKESNEGESDRRIPTLTISSTDMTMQINCGMPVDARRRPPLSRTCHICNKVFARTTTLRRHMIVHEKTYKCSKCSRNLRKDKFLAHLAWCGQAVSPKSEDNKGVSTETKGIVPQSLSQEKKVQDDELSSCEDTPNSNANVCSKGGCRRHKLTRTCHICHKVFSRTTTLRRHMIIHNRKNVQACHRCNSVFPEGLEFQEHIAQCLVDDATEDNEVFYSSFSALDVYNTNHDSESSSLKESKTSFINNANADYSPDDMAMDKLKQQEDSLVTNTKSSDTDSYPATFARGDAGDEGCKDGKPRVGSEFYSSDHDPISDEKSRSSDFMKKFWLSCHICGKVFLRNETLKRHMEVHENQEQVYNCVTCGLNFYQQNEYADHAAHCYGKRLSSNIQNTYSNTQLEAETKFHPGYPYLKIQQKHSPQSSLAADSKSLVTEDSEVPSLPTPLNITYKRGRPKMSRTCQVCKKTFSRTTVLRIHMQLHQNRPIHKCERCNKNFHGKAKYDSHLILCAALNSKKESFRDPESNASMIKIDNLDSAERGIEQSSKLKCGRPKLTRTCHICHKTFSRTTVLRKHMTIHLNGPKHKCKECGATFRKKTLHLIHIMSCKKVKELDNVSGAFSPGTPVDGSGLPSMVKENVTSSSTYDTGARTSTPTLTPKSEESEFGMGVYPVSDFTLDNKQVRSTEFQDISSEIVGCEVDVKSVLPEHDSSAITSPQGSEKSKKVCGRPKMSRTCNICHKTFSRTTVLRKHMSVHEEKPLHECSACGASFRRRNHLTAHTLKCIEAMQLRHERDALNDVRRMQAECFQNLETAPSVQYDNDNVAQYSSEYKIPRDNVSLKKVLESNDPAPQDYHSINHSMPSPFPIEYLESIGGIPLSMEPEFKSNQINNSMDYNCDSDRLPSLNSSNDLMRQLEHITSTCYRCYKCYASFDRAEDLDEHLLLCTDEIMVLSPPPYADLQDGPFKQSLDPNNSSAEDDISDHLGERRNLCRNVGF